MDSPLMALMTKQSEEWRQPSAVTVAFRQQPSPCNNHIFRTPSLLSPEASWPCQHPALSLLRPTLGNRDKKLILFQWQWIPSVFRTFWFTDVIEKVLEELLMEQDRWYRNSWEKTNELLRNWHLRKPREPSAGGAPGLQATWKLLLSPWTPCWAGRWALVGGTKDRQRTPRCRACWSEKSLLYHLGTSLEG